MKMKKIIKPEIRTQASIKDTWVGPATRTDKYKKYDIPQAEQELLKSMACLPYFIEHEIYPSNFEPGCSNYKLGKIHWSEWNKFVTETRQGVLLAPRDHLKSFISVEAYTLWKIKYNPGVRIHIISKTDGQAKDRIANIQKIIEAASTLQWLKPLDPQSWAKQAIKTTNGAEVKSAGYYSGMRGKHPHILILDDPIEEDVIVSPELNQKSINRFFMTIYPMAEKDTQVLVIGTRQCEGDLYDSLKAPEWETKEYRAITDEAKHEVLFPEKWDWDALMKRKDSIVNSPRGGLRIWKKEYLNDVTSIKGNIVKYSDMQFWLKTGETKPDSGQWTLNNWAPLPKDLAIFQGWDLAVGKKYKGDDYTTCATIGIDRKTKNIYILDMYREYLTFPERIKAVETRGGYYPEVLQIGIEDVAFQDDTVQESIRATNLPIRGVHSTTNKLLRLESACTLFTNHKVYLRPDMEDFIEELVNFPLGLNDDQIDAFDIAVLISRKSKLGARLLWADGDGNRPQKKEDANTEAVQQIASATGKAQVAGTPVPVQTENVPAKEVEMVKEIRPGEYQTYDGVIFWMGDDGVVKRGPIWLLGRTLADTIRHLHERVKGVQESNKSYDGMLKNRI